MPVANLQSYRTVALRVHSTAFGSQGQAKFLEGAVVRYLRASCGFEQIGRPGATPSDVLLDLNVTGAGRGGRGMIRNMNLATLDTLLVLTDGQNGEILGTAKIHGESSGMLINNAAAPENEAIDVVAKSIAELLTKSGCTGPRVAKVEPPAPEPKPDPNAGSAATPDDSHKAEAEALNDQGKEKLQNADMPGALAAFQQAVVLYPDARYEFNACLALEAQEQWANALAACRKARGMNPEARLVTKIDHRIDLLQHHQ